MASIPNITAPNAAPAALEGFAAFLQSKVEEGGEFKPGESIQFAWMWLQVEGDDAGLYVAAPTFGKMPMEFAADCSVALNLVLQQGFVTSSFGLPMEMCHAAQSAIVIKDLQSSERWFMNRTDGEENHASGWYIGAEDSQLDPNDPANLELRSLWELFCLRPEMGEFFLLPPGLIVALEDTPKVLKDGEPLAPLEDSYFAQKFPDSFAN